VCKVGVAPAMWQQCSAVACYSRAGGGSSRSNSSSSKGVYILVGWVLAGHAQRLD
jgi:hypothetical protein